MRLRIVLLFAGAGVPTGGLEATGAAATPLVVPPERCTGVGCGMTGGVPVGEVADMEFELVTEME